MTGQIKANVFFEEDKDLISILGEFEELFKDFSKCFNLYLEGKWEDSLKEFTSFLENYPNDGPSINLSKLIIDHKCKAPDNWKGIRELREK